MLHLNNRCQICESNCALGHTPGVYILGNTTLIFKCPCQIFVTPVAEVQMAIFKFCLRMLLLVLTLNKETVIFSGA